MDKKNVQNWKVKILLGKKIVKNIINSPNILKGIYYIEPF
jgi:hypothetical protein